MQICVRVRVRMHRRARYSHACTSASIHKSMALSSYELIATFEYVYAHKGSGHSEKLARKQVWHVSMNDGNTLDAIAARVDWLDDLNSLIDASLKS